MLLFFLNRCLKHKMYNWEYANTQKDTQTEHTVLPGEVMINFSAGELCVSWQKHLAV